MSDQRPGAACGPALGIVLVVVGWILTTAVIVLAALVNSADDPGSGGQNAGGAAVMIGLATAIAAGVIFAIVRSGGDTTPPAGD